MINRHLNAIGHYAKLFLFSLIRDRRYVLTISLGYISIAILIAFSSQVPTIGLVGARTRYGVFGALRVVITATMLTLAHSIFAADRNFYQAMYSPYESSHRSYVILLIHIFYARFLALIPIFAFVEVCMTAIIYPIVKLRPGFNHVLVFYIILFLHTMAARAYGMLSAAVFRGYNSSGLFILFFVILNVIFSGTPIIILLSGALVDPTTITPILKWLHYIAVSYPVTLAYLHNQFNGTVVAPGVTGKQFLESLGLTDLGLWGSLGLLIGQLLAAIILTPIFLYLSEVIHLMTPTRH